MTSHELHQPVLLVEALRLLAPAPNGSFIDATIGRGGHAEEILRRTGPSGRLLGIDADPEAIEGSRRHLAEFGDRVVLWEGYFDQLTMAAQTHRFNGVEGILFDLGVSSPQLREPKRGFSFQAPGPLDMRMGPSAGATAGDLVNSASEAELIRIFSEYGEEHYARRIARAIVRARSTRRLDSTEELSRLVAESVPRSSRIHPATRVFQARALLGNGGRLVVISFHSLEDRLVKRFLQTESRGCVCPPDIPICVCGKNPSLRILTRKPLRPSDEERRANPRSRSAKLRAAEVIHQQGGE